MLRELYVHEEVPASDKGPLGELLRQSHTSKVVIVSHYLCLGLPMQQPQQGSHTRGIPSPSKFRQIYTQTCLDVAREDSLT